MTSRSLLARRFMLILAGMFTFGAIVVGCANNNSETSDAPGSDDANPSAEGGSIADDAPDPESVDADELDIIDEWEEAGVPRFRDGEVLDFEPHASQIKNGGTLLLDGVEASPPEVIAFYRGALGELGWQERRVGESEMTAESDVASLLVTVNEYEGETLIMMILTDRLDDSS